MASSPHDPARARRVILQHARTASLLGVDHVPVHWPDDAVPGEIEQTAAEASQANARPSEVSSRSSTAQQAEVKFSLASEPGPTTGPTPGPASSSSRGPSRAADPEKAPAPASSAYRPIVLADEPRTREQNEALLARVRAQYEADRPHERFNTRHSNVVWGEGDACAALMFVGEAPGETEDQTGRPFVGRAGELLTKMIGAMGLSREQVYIANVVKVRPPDNATPGVEETEASAPYLFDQIRIIAPRVIVTLGLPATRTVLATGEAMRELRGRFAEFPPAHARRSGPFAVFEELPTIPVMPTYHPAYLLRSYTPENRQKAWSDLQMVMERLGLKQE